MSHVVHKQIATDGTGSTVSVHNFKIAVILKIRLHVTCFEKKIQASVCSTHCTTGIGFINFFKKWKLCEKCIHVHIGQVHVTLLPLCEHINCTSANALEILHKIMCK